MDRLRQLREHRDVPRAPVPTVLIAAVVTTALVAAAALVIWLRRVSG